MFKKLEINCTKNLNDLVLSQKVGSNLITKLGLIS
jgi:hypothetical protein